MTIKILQDQLTFEFAVDTPNIADTLCNFEIFSPFSNTTLLDLEATLIESNDRYSRFQCNVPVDLWDKHYNGMYTYILYKDSTIYDTGSFKLITQPGGDMGTHPHISDNENRQSQVVYRPNY